MCPSQGSGLDCEQDSSAVSYGGSLGGLEGVKGAQANLLMLLKRERRLSETIRMAKIPGGRWSRSNFPGS